MFGPPQIINKRCKAFTITEVVVASLLLAVAIVPILKALTSAHVSSALIERRTRSLILAQAKLDQIRARSIYNYGASFAEDSNSLDGSYLCKVTDNLGDPLKTITVSVGFDLDDDDSLDADEINITLATLIARRWPD
jgi:type II secretory pathway pseudopilin PulG